GFTYGVALSKTNGHAVLRFANADILPYRFSDMADHIQAYMQQIIDQSNSMRRETEFAQKLRKKNAYILAADPTKTYYPPKIEEEVPHLNFAPLKNAVDHL